MPAIAESYACYDLACEGVVAKEKILVRKSFYINENTLRRAKRALRVRTGAEAIRLSLEHVAEMERFWQLMAKSRGVLKRNSFDIS